MVLLYKTSEPIQTEGGLVLENTFTATLAKKFRPYLDAWIVSERKAQRHQTVFVAIPLLQNNNDE